MKKALAAVSGLALLVPAAAAADGLPVMGVNGGSGVVSRDGVDRYVTFPNQRSTLIARLHVKGGAVERYRTIPGRFTIPLVAYDGSADGLSPDGRRLIVIRPRNSVSAKSTRLAVMDTTRLQIRKRIVLRGDFSFDALSPDGSTAYLIEYRALSGNNFDPTNYRVRALDLAHGRLLPAPIVDPREPGEKMGGWPVTRTTSPDGRWAYTLYSGSDHPFIHALDMTGRSARCIDLDALKGREDLFQLRLRVTHGGDQVDVMKGETPLVGVDTHSFNVREPDASAATAPRTPAPARANDDGAPLWPWVAGAVALLALLGIASSKPLARMTRTR